ncbi:MAG: ABC transporter ATP-binding protein [Planctomycetota bacterium]
MSDVQASEGGVVLSARELSKSFELGGQKIQVLEKASLDIHQGEVLAIVGSSGAGKSTLLHILGLLDPPDEGAVSRMGKDLTGLGKAEKARARNAYIGFVFQFYHLIPELTTLQNVLLNPMIRQGVGAYLGSRSRHHERAMELLNYLGLGQRLKHRPPQLSGGERQRVAIARALIGDPEILLCDEPTGNLDRKTATGILDLLWRLNRDRQQTMVIVTHDDHVAERAHRVVELFDGKIRTQERQAS